MEEMKLYEKETNGQGNTIKMEEKNLTDEEIVKALKKQPAHDTVLWLEKGINAADILNLIHRLQSEIKYKTECYDELCEMNNGIAYEMSEQKAEIERLTREKTESAKTAVEVLEQNIELQKQVDELTKENSRLDKNVKWFQEKIENGELVSEQAVKDAVKKYNDFVHALIFKYNSGIDDSVYENMHKEANEFAKRKGVEVE